MKSSAEVQTATETDYKYGKVLLQDKPEKFNLGTKVGQTLLSFVAEFVCYHRRALCSCRSGQCSMGPVEPVSVDLRVFRIIAI